MTREENRKLVEELRPLLETISKSAIVLEVGINIHASEKRYCMA